MKRKSWSGVIAILLVMIMTLSACAPKEPVEVVEPEPKPDLEVVDNKPVLLGAIEQFQPTEVSVPFEKRVFETLVEPYSVNKDLSNIQNLDIFGEFSKEQLELLKQNNFVVSPSMQEQLFYVYEENEYKAIPSFITTDSVLQVYHIFYDYTLRVLESEKLLNIIQELTENMLNDSIKIYESLENEEVKAAALKNLAYFSVGQLALEKQLPNGLPEEAKRLAEAELEKINNHEGFDESALYPYYDLDYSQFTPRGHYTRSEDLTRYFKAMMWYGQAPFPLYFEEPDRNIEQTLQALLITYSIYSEEENFLKWENIYEPTNFFVGSSDDLAIYEYGELLFKIYGDEIDLNELNHPGKLDEFYKEADTLPEPKIKGKFTTVRMPVGKQFRFMGQRYVLDADIIQELVEPIVRPVPSGLDVMAVLGSERALEIQLDQEVNQHWDEYESEVLRLKGKFGKLNEEEWMKNMYNGWMWTLKGYLDPFTEGYPSFMTNMSWVHKDLNTALGSWSELKHDTILYGKQSGAEMGGEWYEDVVGYVEPNIEVYEKLLWLTKFSRANLKARGLSVISIDEKMEEFETHLEFLINCSIKQLRNEELTREEYDTIQYFGGILEGLTSSFAGDGMRWHEITSETDKHMAVIADYHTIAPNPLSEGGYMEAGVGPAYEIYVVVPIDGKLYLTRGAVFSFHEFISDERLTDEKWQEMLKDGTNQPMPEWTDNFIREGKGEIPYPESLYN